MKLYRFCLLLFIFAIVFTGCSGGGGGAASGDGPNKKQPVASEKNCNWTIEINDSKAGSYKVFGKELKCDIKLELVAWKDGGTDVYGKYKGEAFIAANVDISGLSNEDLQLLGGGLFDRKCEQLEFTIEEYDADEYIKHISGIPGKISVAPLGDFNGMSNFRSNWATVLNEDQTAIERKSGKTLYRGKNSSGDGQQVPMGINILVEGVGVTVEIPTYSSVWGTGPFKGKITGEPASSGRKQKPTLPSEEGSGIGNGTGDGNMEGAGNNNSSGENGSGEGTESTGGNDEDGGMGNDGSEETGKENVKGKIIYTPDGDIAGFDIDGDGKMEVYMNEDGSTSMDTDGDGKPDKTFEAEYGEG